MDENKQMFNKKSEIGSSNNNDNRNDTSTSRMVIVSEDVLILLEKQMSELRSLVSMLNRPEEVIFDNEEAAKQRNVAGEIMGARMAIDFCLRQGIEAVSIYHDYEGIGKWADGKWKANNPLTQGYSQYVANARTRMSIEFVKVKAHAGNKYNEMADKLAKEALGI